MAADDSSNSSNSSMGTWGSIAVLAVLLIIMATQFGRIKNALNEMMGSAPPSEVVVPTAAQLKQFDLSKIAAGKEFASKADEYDFAKAINDEPVAANDGAAGYVQDGDLVIGVVSGDDACAFPLSIMRHHLLANTKVGDKLLIVSYSPLTSSTAVHVNPGSAPFAPTNQVFNSALIIHDTEGGENTAYSHLSGEGLVGPAAGKKLVPVPHSVTTWERWKKAHPKTRVVKQDSAGNIRYDINRYTAYLVDAAEPYYPAANKDDSVSWKQPVLGVRVGDAAKAYPLDQLKKAGKPVTDELGGKKFTIEYFEPTPDQPLAVITQADDGVTSQPALWFAWHAFYPTTQVYGK
ncbi:MAG: DUF3179 domain-containing (seleno)protein [Pirellulales bacterium]